MDHSNFESTNPSDGGPDAIGLALTDALAHNLLDFNPPDPNHGANNLTALPLGPVADGGETANPLSDHTTAAESMLANTLTTGTLDPVIEALVNRLVAARLQDTQSRFDIETRNWRSQEAALITRDINTRKELEELKTKLALETQLRTTAVNVPPANAPRKRRRRSTATVPDVSPTSPARNTRSITRRLTLEATNTSLDTTSGPILNEPGHVLVDEPQPMEDIDAHEQTINPLVPVDQSNPHSPSNDNDNISTPATVTQAPVVETPQPRGTGRRHSLRHSSHNNEGPNSLLQSAPNPPSRQTRESRVPSTPRPAPVLSQHTRPATRATSRLPHAQTNAPVAPAMVPQTSQQRPKKSRNVVKAAAEVYRFLPQDMPDAIDGLKKAMDLHCRILWGLLDSKAVPQDPPSKLLDMFNIRFSTEAQLHASQESGPELVPLNLVKIGTLIAAQPGRIGRYARLVEENMLTYIQVRLSRLGFDQWCPDLRQTPYSLFNSACRIVALDTFKQALVSNTYEHLQPNLSYTQNMELLVKLYDHFVYHYMHSRYKKESRAPGSVEQELLTSPVYKNRQRLANARADFLRENGYPKRYLDLIDPKATSDDELDEGGKIYWIKRRPERSVEAEQFFRILDAKREEYAKQTKPRQWRERTRLVPTTGQQDSPFKVIADNMPIDYFDPTFFNRQQPRTRNRIAIRQVALLPDVANSFTWCADERLSDSVFMRKYGRQVTSHYNIVNDSDLRTVPEEVEDEEGFQILGEDEGEGDWIDDDEARSEDTEEIFNVTENSQSTDSNGTEDMSISDSSGSQSSVQSGGDTIVVLPTNPDA